MTDPNQIHEELCSIARQRQRLHAREARLLVLAEDLEIWKLFDCISLFEYLERYCDLHPRTAREYLRVARALTVLPTMRGLLENEQINYSTARELTRVATGENEVKWLQAVEGLTAREIEEEVSGHAHGDGPDDPKDPDRVVKLVLQVRASTYGAFLQARSRFTDERGERLSDDEVVLAMCRERPEGDADAAPPYQLSITTCRSCVRSFLYAAAREVEVSASMVAAARCDARHIGDLESDAPQRAFASVTPRMRRQVLERDRNMCSVPGCRSKRYLDVHHIAFQANGGPNKPSNLSTTCFGHHQQLHEGKLVVTGSAPHDLKWYWPGDPMRTSTRDRPRCESAAHVGHDPESEVVRDVAAHVGRSLTDD
jgi:hypothetical protein